MNKKHCRQIVLWPVVALFAAETGLAQTSLNVANVPGYPGATVAVPVSLRQATNVTAAQFDVAYNTNYVNWLVEVKRRG